MSVFVAAWLIIAASGISAALGSGITIALALYSTRVGGRLFGIMPVSSAADQISAVHQAARETMWAVVQQRLRERQDGPNHNSGQRKAR